MTILSVVGARPQFIKAATVSRAIRSVRGLRQILVHTGQHYDAGMSDVFFKDLKLPTPDRHLGIGSAPHAAQVGRMLEALGSCIAEQRPDWVVVYGDTNSTLAGALAAAKLAVPVAHVEAGLRSFNRQMPEEINRVVTDHVSTLLFAPTKGAVAQLRREGIAGRRVAAVGDVMYDAALYYGERAERDSDILKRLRLSPRQFVLATIHRAENTDDARRLRAIFDALDRLARDIIVVVPTHPRTRLALKRIGRSPAAGRVRLIDPVGYLDMTVLEKHAAMIATDSGGVQKEAYFHHVPCVTLRTETEWAELVASGWNTVVPPISSDAVFRGLRRVLLANRPARRRSSLYGSGDAARRIVARLKEAPVMWSRIKS